MGWLWRKRSHDLVRQPDAPAACQGQQQQVGVEAVAARQQGQRRRQRAEDHVRQRMHGAQDRNSASAGKFSRRRAERQEATSAAVNASAARMAGKGAALDQGRGVENSRIAQPGDQRSQWEKDGKQPGCQ